MNLKTIFRSGLILGLAAGFVVTSNVQAANPWVLTYQSKRLNNTTLLSEIVTQDGTDAAYILRQATGGAVKFSTPAGNTGGNTREFFWPANATDSMDQLSCAVWTRQTGEGGQTTQQGAVLRMHQGENGGTRGITVMKNIWYGATWIFNVHVWDTSSDTPYVQQASFDMSEVVGKMWYDEAGNLNSSMRPLPWRLCARTVGDKLQFKVWTNEQEKQPSWNDPKFVREMPIPAEWNVPGKAGWYIGHLKPGHTATFNNLRISQRQ